jgi:hypothetical protein
MIALGIIEPHAIIVYGAHVTHIKPYHDRNKRLGIPS